MLFDKFLKIVENNTAFFDDYFGLDSLNFINDINLFVFEQLPHSLPNEIENYEFINQYFQLPFPSIAIEDKAGLMLILDTHEDQKGLNNKRIVIELISSHAPSDAYNPNMINISDNDIRYKQDEIVQIHMGMVNSLEYLDASTHKLNNFFEYGYNVDKDCKIERFLEAKDSIDPLRKNLFEHTSKVFTTNIIASFEELFYFNHPKNFILEELPLKKRKKPKKALRSHEKSIFTMLTPDKIRSKIGINNSGEGKKKKPHERRRHFRRKKSGGFTPVKACWVGDSEKIIGNKMYKVRLDI
ncbi:MAG: hypothetical protein GY760_23495 [Deltaproteobacteria bacterium]|nr:hypothetical protein [Deltaproteobacteria bacterium]